MDNRIAYGQTLDSITTSNATSNKNKTKKDNNVNNREWRTYFTPEKLKLFHTIVLILFLVLIMSYIFNTKSNILRVIIILSLSALMLCESFVIYSYNWVM